MAIQIMVGREEHTLVCPPVTTMLWHHNRYPDMVAAGLQPIDGYEHTLWKASKQGGSNYDFWRIVDPSTYLGANDLAEWLIYTDNGATLLGRYGEARYLHSVTQCDGRTHYHPQEFITLGKLLSFQGMFGKSGLTPAIAKDVVAGKLFTSDIGDDYVWVSTPPNHIPLVDHYQKKLKLSRKRP